MCILRGQQTRAGLEYNYRRNLYLIGEDEGKILPFPHREKARWSRFRSDGETRRSTAKRNEGKGRAGRAERTHVREVGPFRVDETDSIIGEHGRVEFRKSQFSRR